jgi:lysophospholipase L1-like esterase
MQALYDSSVSFRSRGRLIVCAIAVVALSAMMFAPGAATAATAEVEPAATPATVTNYLALGDSITFGYTEEKFNINYPNESPSYFEEGFDNFFNNDLKKETEVGKGSTIVNDSCPGETSNTLIGENEAIGGKKSTEPSGSNGLGDYHPCPYHFEDGFPLHNSLGDLSQLEEALSLLKEGHPAHEVKAITLNIGANDELAAVAQCEKEVGEEYGKEGKSKYGATPEEAVKGCIIYTAEHVTFPHIVGNIADILGVLDSTEPGGGHYTGPIVLLGFYNPYSFTLPGSDVLQVRLNQAIEKEVVPHFPNVTYANPYPVFNKGPSEAKEQESICKYTEMCNPNVQKPGGKPAGKDGDIHPTVTGYKALAKLVNEAWLANPAR